MTFEELNQGDALHDVQIIIAVTSPDHKELKERVDMVINIVKPWFSLRQEIGEAQAEAAKFFSNIASKDISIPHTTWSVVSRELAMLFSPLGYRKLAGLDGTLRGEAGGGRYPVFHDSWRDKRATHEVWVGVSGYGKTFALNCLLTRQFAEGGVPFTLVEPMGHGKHLAEAFGLPWYVMSARRTCLNPQDVMFPTLVEQKAHTIRLYETILGRRLSGAQKENQERGLLGEALEILYTGFGNLESITPDVAPLIETVCDMLSGLGDKPHIQQIARDLADEIGGLCTGKGPWAEFDNDTTNIDLSARNKSQPQVFSFHEMEHDPIMLAIAYTQVLSANLSAAVSLVSMTRHLLHQQKSEVREAHHLWFIVFLLSSSIAATLFLVDGIEKLLTDWRVINTNLYVMAEISRTIYMLSLGILIGPDRYLYWIYYPVRLRTYARLKRLSEMIYHETGLSVPYDIPQSRIFTLNSAEFANYRMYITILDQFPYLPPESTLYQQLRAIVEQKASYPETVQQFLQLVQTGVTE